MTETKTFVAGAPVWVDHSSKEPAAARDYYAKLFGWDVEVLPDSEYGGYGMARLEGKDVAGIGPTMDPQAPSAWMAYIGTDDADATAGKVEAAGGKVVAPPFEVGEAGRMAVFQDPAGTYISVWQPRDMAGASLVHEPNTFAWAELNARGLARAKPFYTEVFGWSERVTPTGEGNPPYTEFLLGGQSIAGGMEMNPMVPAEVPSHWMVYFAVNDVDEAFQRATAAGRELLAPQDFPGGRFAIVQDPQGAAFGLLKMQR